MSTLHNEHVARHVQKTLKVHGEETVEKLLKNCRLSLAGKNVLKSNGDEISDDDCRVYLSEVQNVLGEMAHSFAKANFALAGCCGTLQ